MELLRLVAADPALDGTLAKGAREGAICPSPTTLGLYTGAWRAPLPLPLPLPR